MEIGGLGAGGGVNGVSSGGDTFILTTDKKLRSNWSSHSFGLAITSPDIDKLRNNFDFFDKKTKMKILISLISMDKDIRSSNISSIKRLLSLACNDKDEWVPVIAGLVHGKIFTVTDPLIQSRTDKIIHDTVENIIRELPVDIQPDKILDFLNYQPYEESFFTRNNNVNVNLNTTTTTITNPHFQYTSSGLNFFERELRIMEERKAKEQTILAKRSSQVPVVSSNSTAGLGLGGPHNRSTAISSSSSSGLRSLSQSEPKKTAKTISDAKIREIEKKRKLGEEEPKKQEKIPRVEGKNTLLSASLDPSPGMTTNAHSSLLRASQPAHLAMPSKHNPEHMTVPAHVSPRPSLPTPSSSSLQFESAGNNNLPPPLLPISSSLPLPPAPQLSENKSHHPPIPPISINTANSVAATATAAPSSSPSSSLLSSSSQAPSHSEIPEILQSSQYGSLISTFFDEGVLLSSSDKQQIIKFYLDRLSNPDSTPSPQDIANPPIEQKFKLYEKDSINKEGQVRPATYYLILSSNGQWKKTMKSKK